MEFTYGQEVELADISRDTKLPDTMSYSSTELDIVSSCGAIDPSGRDHKIGGEINTKPTKSIEEQINIFNDMLRLFPEATINHRHHHHLHIAFPGLKTDLNIQKKLLKYIVENTKTVVDKIFVPTKNPKMNTSSWRYQTVDRDAMAPWRYEFCINANTCEDFFASHAKVKDGRILYQTMKRMAFNLYSIKKHGTVEMRCLFPTLNPDEVRYSFIFFRDFILEALSEHPRPIDQAVDFNNYIFPKEVPYNHKLEILWQTTNKKK